MKGEILNWSNLLGGTIVGAATWFFADFFVRRRFWQIRAEIVERMTFFGNLPTHERGADLKNRCRKNRRSYEHLSTAWRANALIRDDRNNCHVVVTPLRLRSRTGGPPSDRLLQHDYDKGWRARSASRGNLRIVAYQRMKGGNRAEVKAEVGGVN
jgi:hypothetical protein